MTLPFSLDRLRLPAMGAPILLTSDLAIVVETCQGGLLGTFPALNHRTSAGFEDRLHQIEGRMAEAPGAAPYGVNLIVQKSNDRLGADLDIVVKHRVPVVITAFGAARDVIDAVHSYGGIIALGVGAGGHAGHLSPFAADIVAVRAMGAALVSIAPVSSLPAS